MSRLRAASRVFALLGGVLTVLIAGCSLGGGDAPTAYPTPGAAGSSPSSTGSASPSTTAATCRSAEASYPPLAQLPPPGRMPAGSTMRRIQQRGRLIAGVSADTLLFGARNPFTGQLEGFDIDLLRAISQAIFGSPDRIEFRVITAAQRIPLLQDGSVDVVARNMTVTCDRWQQLAFSAVYYSAGQKVLVADAGARTPTGIRDLAGRRVCAPKGSTTIETLRRFPEVEPVGADTHTECLVRFQRGEVDAISGDDAVLAGMAAQDPYARVVGEAFTDEPYGLGVRRQNTDLVRFINAVLAQVRADGRWGDSYNRWLREALGPGRPPAPDYSRPVP